MYNEESNTVFDLKEILKRALKYFVEGAMVALAAFFIQERRWKGRNPMLH